MRDVKLSLRIVPGDTVVVSGMEHPAKVVEVAFDGYSLSYLIRFWPPYAEPISAWVADHEVHLSEPGDLRPHLPT